MKSRMGLAVEYVQNDETIMVIHLMLMAVADFSMEEITTPFPKDSYDDVSGRSRISLCPFA